MNLILGEHWVFRTDLIHNYYDGLSDGFNQNYFLWNVSLGRKFLKDNRGDLRFKVYDLLNQNTQISLPEYKETHFFSRDYNKGINWYLKQVTGLIIVLLVILTDSSSPVYGQRPSRTTADY